MVDLTKDEAYAIAEHIDMTLLDEVRSNVDIDSMMWLRNIVHGYEKLCRYGGYTGLTEPKEDGDKDAWRNHQGHGDAGMLCRVLLLQGGKGISGRQILLLEFEGLYRHGTRYDTAT